MNTTEKQYLQALRSACEEIRLDYFPQVEASELLYKVITLGDIYLPLTLEEFDGSYRQPDSITPVNRFSSTEIEELIRRIEEKIEELKKQAADNQFVEEILASDAFSASSESGNALEEIAADPELDAWGEEMLASDAFSDSSESGNALEEIAADPELDAWREEMLQLFTDDPWTCWENALDPKEPAGMRMLLRADPGAGKTTFCKRLVLAYLDRDLSFFRKYSEENGLTFHENFFPLLLNCKNIADLPASAVLGKSFPSLAYQLCSLGMGGHLHGISEEAFVQLFEEKVKSGLFLILDGWDEILDPEKEATFREQLDGFLSANPRCDFLVTIRFSYLEPNLKQPFSSKYAIKELNNQDIREFCRKWCEIILSSTAQKKNNHEQIADQIIRSADPQIDRMRRNPLDLSLLLTVSKNDGRLPDNKADLFKELVDLYIFWSTRKSKGGLSSKSIRVFLAYIATHFTKNKKLFCSYEELTGIVRQCLADLSWSFSEDLSQMEVQSIIKELSHTGILTCTYDGNNYTFAESSKGSHRQMQEYLTAYAIQVQYADEEYNNMSPVEIFEDKYGSQEWREVILFISLMNNGRLRHEIIKRLIAKAQDPAKDNYHYTNLLFDMIVNAADVRQTEKYTIYDLLFEEHITDRQISNIISLVESNNRIAAEFIAYIDEKFSSSVAEGNPKYCFAKAMIESSRALTREISPFSVAEILLVHGRSDEKIITAASIILIMAWCAYAGIDNAFRPYYRSYVMHEEVICAIKDLLKRGVCRLNLLKCVKEAILADYVSFDDLFSQKDIDACYHEIETQENPEGAEIILSMAPIFDSAFRSHKPSDPKICEKYLGRLRTEQYRRQDDKMIFTFSICAALECWGTSNVDSEWDSIRAIYSRPKARRGMGKIRFNNLIREKRIAYMERLLDAEKPVTDMLPAVRRSAQQSGEPVWVFTGETKGWLKFVCGDKTREVHCPQKLLPEANQMIRDTAMKCPEKLDTCLAYLCRRKEVHINQIENGKRSVLTPEELLDAGVKAYEPFAMVNRALSSAQTFCHAVGDPEMGRMKLSFMLQRLPAAYSDEVWKDTINWWLNLAHEHQEPEGVIVIHWLWNFGIFDPERFSSDCLKSLISLAQKLPKDIVPRIDDFTVDLKWELRARQS